MRLVPLLLALVLLASRPGAAHEFWIEPEAYQVAPGEAITAHLRNGERFSGRSLSLIPRNIRRFEIVQQDAAAPVEGRIGDRPALSHAAPGEGLAVVVHETAGRTVEHDEAEGFERFARHKDFPWAVGAHAERGLGLPVRERYRRYAKSLVAVGHGAGRDRPMGLRAEIVALANPYEGARDALPVEVRFEGEPAPGRQLEVFRRGADGAVSIFTLRTDAAGRALVPLERGEEVMLDAVFIEPLEEDPDGAHWMTHWANLTFAVP